MNADSVAYPTPSSATRPGQGTSAFTLCRAALYLALVGLTLSPLLRVTIPPLVDYPNHLARMWILAGGPDLAGTVQNYVVHWRILPNLGMDLVVPPLARIMPLAAAGRVFVGAVMVLLVGGTATLHRVLHGRVGLWPLCSLLFIYNAAMFWGFLNFLFGIGLYLFAFAGWIAARRLPVAARIAAFSAIASLLLIVHLFGFGLYALTVACFEIGDRLSRRRVTAASVLALGRDLSLWADAAQFVVPLLIWWASLGAGGPSFTQYGPLGSKLYALVAPTTYGIVPTMLDSLTLLTGIGFLLVAMRGRLIRLAPGMRLTVGVLIVTTALIPSWLDGSAMADIRLPITLPFVIIAGTAIDVRADRRLAAFALVAVALFAARIWSVTESWQDADRRFGEFRTASAVIPQGARLLIVANDMPAAAAKIAGVPAILAERTIDTYRHMPALAVIDRDAFIPYLFTGMTPVVPTARNAGLFRTQGNPITPADLAASADPEQSKSLQTPWWLGEEPYWRDWPQHFDYVLWLDFGTEPTPDDFPLQAVTSGSFFHIYRVRHP